MDIFNRRRVAELEKTTTDLENYINVLINENKSYQKAIDKLSDKNKKLTKMIGGK